MLKNILYITFTFLTINLFGQVGIQTENPREEVQLDVNGKVNVVHRIHLGGSDLNQQGSEGADKQLIVSGGAGSNPTGWGNKQIPNGLGETVTLTYMNTWYDNTGVDLAPNGTDGYSETNTLNDAGSGCTAGNCWKVLPGLNQNLIVYKPGNKVNFIFQTTAQIQNSGGIATFACGLFMNTPTAPNTFTLRGVRTEEVFTEAAGNYRLFTMNITLEDLPVPGGAGGTTYDFRVACRGRNMTSQQIAVGKVLNSSHLNQDMAQSSLNLSVLEAW